jgi:diguanylate cyclase (GGDEF)-like protein
MMRRDPLTGLADRSVLLERLESLLSSERCSAPQFALLFVDLNDFKQVNDQWGHVVGDGLVADVARRLASCVRAGDTLVRYGGDEFVALLAGADSHNAYVSVVQRMHEMLGEPFELPDGTVQAITASIGTVDSSGPWKTSSELINAADQAMYQSKRSQSGTRESARP